ncbi:MAG: hypothetical protein U9R23_07710 [Candidatus Cloacimonadota bacterium]|nr:hypothetical protein [Candidatus Cloacimonadota bacterium]
MPHTVRNTIVLVVLLLIVIIGIILANANYVKRLEKLKKSNKENSEMQERLRKENPDLENEEKVMESLDDMKKQVLENSKLILKEDTPTLTYQYLVDIADNFCPDVSFNFQISKSGKVKEFSFNTYTISGDANIKSLYFFVFQIEYQSPLYTIESIKIAEQSVAKADTVSFTITLNAYYNEDGTELQNILFRNFRFTNLRYNPFYSRIHTPISDEYELKFLNIYTSTIIGLSPYKAFLRDDKGRIHTLRTGEKVAYGYLDHINWYKQAAVFTINRIGIPEEKIIYMNEDKL